MSSKPFFDPSLDGWQKVVNKWNEGRPIFLCLDYDGTLVPIEKSPHLAILSPDMRTLISKLSKHPSIEISIVTGRSLSHIKHLIHIPKIHYIANHGFEIFSPYIRWIHPEAKSIIPILEIGNKELQKKLSSITGILLENKHVTLSIHYRNVSVRHIKAIKQAVISVVSSYSHVLKITRGKKVLEIRPNILWDKGFAVLKFLESADFPTNILPIYLGDDSTDEDAFYKLNPGGITIRVGRFKDSSAQYFLQNTNEVKHFLERILKISSEIISQ